MKMIARLIAPALIFAAAGNASAGAFTNPGKIQEIMISHDIAGIQIRHAFMSNPDGCARQDYFVLRSGNPLFKEMYSLLLSAQLLGQPLNLAISGCNQGMPEILNIVSTIN